VLYVVSCDLSTSQNISYLGGPIAHDETLETKLTLEKIVLKVTVPASVGVVDLVVRAHDGTSAGADGVSERPQVQLVQSNVINVRANGLVDGATGLSAALTEMLLLVEDEVLCASNDASILDTFH